MSNLNEKQFRLFHGTTNKTVRGGVIQPRKQRGPEWDGDGPVQAFASSHLEDAATYGHNVYEVEPNKWMDNYGSGVYASNEGFKVKRKLKPEVVERYSRIVKPIRDKQYATDHGKWMYEHNKITHGSGWGPTGSVHISYDKDGNEHQVPVESTMDCSECKKLKG
jgi:hypothetical protein